MLKVRPCYGTVGAALLAAVCLAVVGYPRPLHPTSAASLRREMRADELRAASASICRAIAPKESRLEIAVIPGETRSAGYYIVRCNSITGAGIATFVWDARNRNVRWVGCQWAFWGQRAPVMNDVRVVRSARYWLAVLHMVRDPDAWQPLSVDRDKYLATVTLSSQGHRVRVRVNERTGDLASAVCGTDEDAAPPRVREFRARRRWCGSAPPGGALASYGAGS